MIEQQALARFVDRHTMVYDRWYPHEIDLVFEAVSTGEHLDVWLLPESRVERRVGGACVFGWGSPADDPAASRGTVTEFEPPTAIQYSMDDGGYMRFDLAPEGEGTRLHFTLYFMPTDTVEDPYPGGDLPAGPGTAWRPGFLAGFHEFLDDLFGYLTGEFTADDRAAMLADPQAGQHALIDQYRAHVRDNCPAE